MLKNSLACTLLVCLGVVMQGCGAAEVGEACATRGEQEECVENAICDSTSDSAEPICLKVCTDDAQCASTEACNGVSGSNIKACKPKTK